MIILEGTDHTGKTTLAQQLCDRMSKHFGRISGAYYGHMSKPPEGFDHVTEYMNAVRLGVQDRFHLGSIVYGRILGGGSFTSARRMKIVQAYLRWRGCRVIVITCNRDVLRDRLRAKVDRPEMYRIDQILDAGEAFRGLAASQNLGEAYADEVVDVSDQWVSNDRIDAIFEAWQRSFML